MWRMAIFMRRRVRAAGSLLFLVALSACDSGTAITMVNIKGIKGQFVLTTSGMNIPLTANKIIVEYRYGSDKETLFSGYGGDPVLMVDRPNAVLVIGSLRQSTNRESGWRLRRKTFFIRSGRPRLSGTAYQQSRLLLSRQSQSACRRLGNTRHFSPGDAIRKIGSFRKAQWKSTRERLDDESPAMTGT